MMITVIMPCFNAERWLTYAIDSILRQTFGDFELVAIDDGSTDSTPDILTSLSHIDSRVRILSVQHNRGIVAALNHGLDLARGDFIARMDADDIAMPQRFARQIETLRAGIDLCGSWFTEFGLGVPRTARWPSAETAVRAAMLFQNTICHPTVMAKRTVFERLRYREEYRLAEDYDLFVRTCAEFRVANVPEALVRYRRHPQQATLAKREAMEAVTCRIRLNMLRQQGFEPTPDEQRLHNLIRSPSSISRLDDLQGIEAWLLKLYAFQKTADARRVVASQWLRACVRAAPLGLSMWKAFRASKLRSAAAAGLAADVDLLLLSVARLDYDSTSFSVLRRIGLSA